MKYSVHGPFELGKQKENGLVKCSKDEKADFWSSVEKDCSSLPSACGCYLFAIRAGKGIKPWYVGRSTSQTFEKECFAPHKIKIYHEALASKKGTPVLFLVAKRTNGGKFVKPGKNSHEATEYLETLMIGAALEKNPKLMNIKKTKYLKEMCVPCLINTPQGKPSPSAKAFKEALR